MKICTQGSHSPVHPSGGVTTNSSTAELHGIVRVCLSSRRYIAYTSIYPSYSNQLSFRTCSFRLSSFVLNAVKRFFSCSTMSSGARSTKL